MTWGLARRSHFLASFWVLGCRLVHLVCRWKIAPLPFLNDYVVRLSVLGSLSRIYYALRRACIITASSAAYKMRSWQSIAALASTYTVGIGSQTCDSKVAARPLLRIRPRPNTQSLASGWISPSSNNEHRGLATVKLVFIVLNLPLNILVLLE